MKNKICVNPDDILILVVDDEEPIRKLLQRILTTEGYHVHIVSNAEHAVEWLTQKNPDIVITDIAMPGMDGYELTQHVLKFYSSAVIVMTGQIGTYHYDQFVGAGASDFVEKPFTSEEVVLRVDRVLRERKYQEALLQSHHQLAQSQKLEALGQISAGIVHEIKTPIQYISDNMGFIKETFEQLDVMIEYLLKIYDSSVADSLTTDLLEQIQSKLNIDDLAYFREETPQAIDQSLEGIKQINRIITAIKSFSHPGSQNHLQANLNEAVNHAVTISKNEWKSTAEISLDLDNALPDIQCNPGELTQVFLNLIVNACHAISDKTQLTPGYRGKISIHTKAKKDGIKITISDTGTGIPEDKLLKIYNPFFTTKEIGQGTGQGLAIAHSIIVDRHQGKIEVNTEKDKGTTFSITLPHRYKE